VISIRFLFLLFIVCLSMTTPKDKRKSRSKWSLQFNDLQVKAAGILFYHIAEKSLFILVSEKKVKYKRPPELNTSTISTRRKRDTNEYKIIWEDFGGKVDPDDRSIYDTAVRETLEESNDIFDEGYLRTEIQKVSVQDFVWNANCCYGTFILPLMEKIDPTLLGEKELHDNLDRTCKWVTYADFLRQRKNKIHIRLKTKKLLSVLDKIATLAK
jgi:hypothetical protein